MKKDEYIAAIAEESGVSKKSTEAVLKALVKVVSNGLKNGESFQIAQLGTFKAVKKDERNARNPKTGKAIKVAAHVAPKFVAAAALKELLK